CVQECGHSLHHGNRLEPGLHAERRHHHRDGLRVARPRAPHRAGRARTRLPGDPGGGLRFPAHLRRAERARGSPLRRGRSAGEAFVRRGAGAAVGSLLVLGLVAAAAIFAPLLAPADPITNDLLERLTPPMWSAGGGAAPPPGPPTPRGGRPRPRPPGARVSPLP